MLLSRIVLQLPDRPGSLGVVTTLLGRLGVDIHQMFVLERRSGHATDEFTAVVPGPVIFRQLPDLLEEIDGVTVLEATLVEQPATDGQRWAGTHDSHSAAHSAASGGQPRSPRSLVTASTPS